MIHHEIWYREANGKAWGEALRRALHNGVESWLELWYLSQRMGRKMPEEWGEIFRSKRFPEHPDRAQMDMYLSWLRGPPGLDRMHAKVSRNPGLFLHAIEEDEEAWKDLTGSQLTPVWMAAETLGRIPDVSFSTVDRWFSSGTEDLWIPFTQYPVHIDETGYAESEYGPSIRIREWRLRDILAVLRDETTESEWGRNPYSYIEDADSGGASSWRQEHPDESGHIPTDFSHHFTRLSIQPGHDYKNLTDKLIEWVRA